MRYIVIGAGAIGGTIGGRLAASGHEVVLVARGAHLDALRAKGLTLATPDGTSMLDIPAAASPAELDLREDDVLLLATKTQDAEPLLTEWAWRPVRNGTVAADALPVVCAQNGVASERIALRRFRHVYGMCVWMPSTHLEPGAVEANGAPMTGLLHLGRYPSGTDAIADQIGADLAGSGFLAPVVADVMRWKYGKLLANVSNAIEAVCGHDAWLHATELRRRVTAEGRAVLDAAGIAYARERESAELRAARVQILPVNGAERVGGSSWQSLTRGTGSIEADFLNGEIVLMGRERGIPVPVNEVLQRLANQAARDRRPPGSATPDEVMALAALPADAGSSEPGRLPDQHDVDAAG
jgi:2-dehydropantoate 2-reductase